MITLVTNKVLSSDFANIGSPSITYSSGSVVFNNTNEGDYDISRYIYYPELNVSLKDISISFDYKKTDVNNSSLFVGFKSINPNVSPKTGLHIVNTGDYTTFYIKSSSIYSQDVFISGINLPLNDSISICYRFDHGYSSIEIKQNGVISIFTAPVLSVYNTSNCVFCSTNGGHSISNINIYSRYTDNYDAFVYGDSTSAYPVSAPMFLRKRLSVAISAGQGDSTEELKKAVFTTGGIKRKINLCAIGSNDAGYSLSYETTLNNIIEIDAKLQMLAPTYWLTVMPRNDVSVVTINNLIRTKVPQSRVIEYNRLFWNGSNSAQINPSYSDDGVHLNTIGSKIGADYIYNTLRSMV